MVSARSLACTRAVARCDALTPPPFSDSAEGLTRTYLSPSYFASQDQVAEWITEAGMSVRRDAAMNLIGRFEGCAADAAALVMAAISTACVMPGLMTGRLG